MSVSFGNVEMLSPRLIIWWIIFAASFKRSFCSSIAVETAQLYDELDGIDNEIRRLNDIQSQLIWRKTKILQRLGVLKGTPSIEGSMCSVPTLHPSSAPTPSPTKEPTPSPTNEPTLSPTNKPTNQPTTPSPTHSPTQNPTLSPTIDMNPIKANIQKSKSQNGARRKKKNVSAKDIDQKDDKLLDQMMHSRKSSTDIIKLFTYDSDLNSKQMVDLFEEDLISDHQNDLVILNFGRSLGMDDYPSHVQLIDHPTDVFLTQFIETMIDHIVTRTLSADKLSIAIQHAVQGIALLNFSVILDRALDRLDETVLPLQNVKLLAYITKCNHHRVNPDSPSPHFDDSMGYDVMLYFLQFMFEEVITYKTELAFDDLNRTRYGQSGKVPDTFREDLEASAQTKYVQECVTYLFRMTSSENTSDIFIASEHLKRGLYALNLMTSNFQIGNIIFEWKQNGNAHRVIAISSAPNCENRMIDSFLHNLGYNDSSIERYKIVPNGMQKGTKSKQKYTKIRYEIPSSIHQNIVRIVKYCEIDEHWLDKQLFEANDPRNDLVLVLDSSVLDDAKIKRGRYSLFNPFDVQSAKIMNTVAYFFEHVSGSGRKFTDLYKLMMRATISEIISSYSLLNHLNVSIFDAILDELSISSSSKECAQFCTLIKLGFDLMVKCGEYKELKMIRADIINDAMVDIMFSFIEIVIRQIFVAHLDDFDASMKNSSFIGENSGPMKELFATLDRIKSSSEKEWLNFKKYMKKTKLRCIEGKSHIQKYAVPNILEKMNEFGAIKWLLTMGRICYEWKQHNDKLVVYIAFEELALETLGFNEHKLIQFLYSIGYNNIGVLTQ